MLDRMRWWGDRPFLLLACTAALVSLTLSAANEIAAAVPALRVAVALAVLHAVAHLFRGLPEQDRARFLTRGVIRRIAGLSLVGAAVVSCAYWFGGWVIGVEWPAFVLRHFRDLDFIPSAASLLLPPEWRSGFHQYFRNMTYCFPGPFWWESVRYLRTAIPAYWVVTAILLLIERLLIFSYRHWRAN